MIVLHRETCLRSLERCSCDLSLRHMRSYWRLVVLAWWKASDAHPTCLETPFLVIKGAWTFRRPPRSWRIDHVVKGCVGRILYKARLMKQIQIDFVVAPKRHSWNHCHFFINNQDLTEIEILTWILLAISMFFAAFILWLSSIMMISSTWFSMK